MNTEETKHMSSIISLLLSTLPRNIDTSNGSQCYMGSVKTIYYQELIHFSTNCLKVTPTKIYLVVNAGCKDKDVAHLDK